MSNNNGYLLFDSCVVEYLLQKDIFESFNMLLSDWKSKNYFNNAVISEITYAELLNGANIGKEKKVIEKLDSFSKFQIMERNLIGAGKLGSVYYQENQEYKRISLGDLIIAATSIIENTPILTADVKDFPFPFFKQSISENIQSKKHIYSVAILKPDYNVINSRFKERK